MRYLVGLFVYAGLLLFGYYVLGIRPTFAELLLVTLATSFSIGVQEGLE